MLWWGLTLFKICPFRPFETAGTVGVVVCRIHDGLCGLLVYYSVHGMSRLEWGKVHLGGIFVLSTWW